MDHHDGSDGKRRDGDNQVAESICRPDGGIDHGRGEACRDKPEVARDDSAAAKRVGDHQYNDHVEPVVDDPVRAGSPACPRDQERSEQRHHVKPVRREAVPREREKAKAGSECERDHAEHPSWRRLVERQCARNRH